MLQIFKITFKKDEGGMIVKEYEGIIKPEHNESIEAGISMVINHVYLHKMTPAECFGKSCLTDNLIEIVFSKNHLGDFMVDSCSSKITTNDCENVITGLGELLMRLHLERMANQDIKNTLKRDSRTSSVDYTPDSSLV